MYGTEVYFALARPECVMPRSVAKLVAPVGAALRSAGPTLAHLSVFRVGGLTGIILATAPKTPVNAGERIRKPLAGQCRDIGLTGVVKKLLDFLFTDGKATKSELHSFHCQRKKHEQHWEKYDSETLHTGK